jgi:hypothetical protein
VARFLALAVIAVSAGLTSCSQPSSSLEAGGGHGRYLGVGIYTPGVSWTRIIDAQQTKDSAAAQPIDDQAIIVVEDSRTGEVRACGDLTGYCVGMNPWSAPSSQARRSPVALAEHEKPAGSDNASASDPSPQASAGRPQ